MRFCISYISHAATMISRGVDGSNPHVSSHYQSKWHDFKSDCQPPPMSFNEQYYYTVHMHTSRMHQFNSQTHFLSVRLVDETWQQEFSRSAKKRFSDQFIVWIPRTLLATKLWMIFYFYVLVRSLRSSTHWYWINFRGKNEANLKEIKWRKERRERESEQDVLCSFCYASHLVPEKKIATK